MRDKLILPGAAGFVPARAEPTAPALGNRFLRVFHPLDKPTRATIQEVKAGAVIEASDRLYTVAPDGSLRVQGRPAGTKKERRQARRARAQEGR